MAGKDFPLSITIKTRDQATAGLKRVQDQLERTTKPLQKLSQQTQGLRGRLAGLTGSIGKLGASLGALGVGSALFSAGRDALDFDRSLTRLDISSRGAMGTMDQVRDKVLAVSRATGVAKEDLLSGAAAFVALTGDGGQASAAMTTFAKVQKATGSEMAEVAATAAALSQQLGVTAGDMETAFSILARGGKEGAVEFSDMSSLMASLAASFKGFGKSQGLQGVAQLGAMFQVARKDFGGASETATGLQRFMESLSSPRTIKEFKQLGIEIFKVGRNGKIELRPMVDILDDMAKSKLVSDPRTLNKAFESSEARRAARAILGNVEAVKALAKATENANDISVDFDRNQRSSSERMSKAWNEFKVSVAEAFTPERLSNFVEALGAVAQALGTVVGLVSKILDGWREIGELAGKTVMAVAPDFGKSEAQLHHEHDQLVKREFAGKGDDFVAEQARLGNMGAMQEQRRRRAEFFRENPFPQAPKEDAAQPRKISSMNDALSELKRMFVAKEPDKAQIKIDITGAPRGTRAAVQPGSTANVDLTTGYQMGAIP